MYRTLDLLKMNKNINRLPDEVIQEIFQTKKRQKILADQFGTYVNMICLIKKGRYPHLTDHLIRDSIKDPQEEIRKYQKEIQGPPIELEFNYLNFPNPKNRSLKDVKRFFKYVVKSEDPDGCWIWIGALNNKKTKAPVFSGLDIGEVPDNGFSNRGRPRTKNSKSRMCSAPRWIYEVMEGEIPRGMNLNHSVHCESVGAGKRCVNPNHVSVGTQLENVQQAHELGLMNQAKGEDHVHAILTSEQVKEIYLSTESNAAISKRMGITHGAISLIRLDKMWLTVTNDLEKPEYESGRSKIPQETALAIFEFEGSTTEAAEYFNVSKQSIHNIRKGKHIFSPNKKLNT